MPAGLEIINDDGAYQLIDNVQSYRLAATKVVSVANSVAGILRSVTVSGSTEAIIVFKSPVAYVHILKKNYYNGAWEILYYYYNTGGASTITFYTFDIGVSATTNNFGLQVFNSSGKLTFSTDRYPFKISGSYSITGSEASPTIKKVGANSSNFGLSHVKSRVIIESTPSYYIKRIYHRTNGSSHQYLLLITGEDTYGVDGIITDDLHYYVDLRNLT